MRVLILSGAGLSAGAGVPTFRDAGGLYRTLIEGETPESVLSAAGYARAPERVERFLHALRERVGASAPSPAHRGCAALEREFDHVVHCTQSIRRSSGGRRRRPYGVGRGRGSAVGGRMLLRRM